jgi:N utilization substance protein B
LAKEELIKRFSPDLNSMEPQDKQLLKSQQHSALKLIEARFHQKPEPETEPLIEKEVQIAFQGLKKNIQKDFSFLKKSTVSEIEQLTDLYYSVLNLLPAFAMVAASDKKSNHDAFINNQVLKSIASNQELRQAAKKPISGWDTRMDQVKIWFRDVVKTDPVYQNYISSALPGNEGQRSILKHLLRKVILGDTAISAYFEEAHIRWLEDREIVKGLAEKSLKTVRSGQPFQLQKLSLDWEEDKAFIENLFEIGAHLPARFHELIARNTVNWEVDRLPLTDRIILQMAIAEFTNLPNIPIKVTINEYIELAKNYSTPKSRQFINGILDVIAKELKKSGDIKKSGRGLIDNK